MHGGCETCGCNWPTYPPRGWPALPLCLKVYLGATCINALLVQALMHMQLWYSCETCGRYWPTTPSRLTCFASVCLCVHCAVILSLFKKWTWNSHLQLYLILCNLSTCNLFYSVWSYCPDVQNRAPLGQLHPFTDAQVTQIHAEPYFTAYEVIGLMSKAEHLWATCN